MGRVILLLEEPSMKVFLLEFLPRLIPGWQHERDFLCVAHRGRTDLERSIPIKLKAWREPGACFVIMRDNDNADCSALKSRLLAMAAITDRKILIRLVCQELESWYLGDPQALVRAYPDVGVNPLALSKKCPNPDARAKPSQDLERWIRGFQKNDGARRLGRTMGWDGNRSHSFQVFIAGMRTLANLAMVP